MTFPTAPGAPQELLASYISVVPSLAGSQGLLRDQLREMAREGGQLWGAEFERSAGEAMRPVMARLGASMAEGLSAGLGASAGQKILSHLLPSESVVASHMGRLGSAAGGSYVREFNAKFKDMVPVINDVSARAVAANKALVETTRQMGGQMSQFWYRSSKEATAAGDQMMADWASKMKVGVALAGVAAAIEFVHSVKKEFKAFEHVGEDAAQTLVTGFHTVLQGKMPDLLAPFDVLEEAAKTAMTAPLQIAETFVPGLKVVRKAIEETFGPLDKLKDMFAPVMDDMIEVGDQYLELQRKLAESTLDPEKIAGLSTVVRDIMASGDVVHFQDVADSIGRLNTNIQGLSTEKLKELTTTFAYAEELVGHIDETKFAGVVNAWKIPADEADSTLTMLVNTARATGIGFNELTGEMLRSGPAFRDMGYSAQQVAAFFGEMAAKGEQGQRLVLAMMELDKKLNDQVEQGKFQNAKAAWDALISSVKAYEDAGKHAAALDLLNQYVSPRVSPMLLEMLDNGKVSAEQLGDAIEGVNSDIGESVEKTKNLGDTFMAIGQQIGAAVAPIGMALAGGLRDAGTHVSEWLKENQGKVAQWGADIAKGFLTVGTFATEWFANTLKAMSPLFEAMKAMVLAVTLPLSPLAHGMAAVFGGGWSTLAGAIDKVNGSMMNLDIGKYLGEFDDSVKNFAENTLPKLDAAIQAPVDDLKLEDSLKKKGFKFWFEDDDPAKVKVKPQTQDGGDVTSSADLVPPGETTLTFVPGFDQPKWHGQAPPQGFAFGGPTVQGDWRGKGDTIPAMLEVGEYVVRRDQAQKHRRELDAINYGYAGFDTGGDVDAGLTVLYGFLRGVAEGVGLNLPKDKAGDGGSGLPAMYATVAGQSAPELAAAAASPGHGGDVKTAAFNAMIAAGGKPSDWPAIDYIFSHESSWNVGAQNNWDINAQHGDPSKGLGQLISENYRAAGVDPNTKDPYQQTYAAVKYMQSRYGSIQAAYEYWTSHRNYAEGGHVGGSWFGATPHDPPGPDTASIAKHFARFAGGGPICAECGGAHPTAFHGGGPVAFAGGGHVGSKEDPNGPAFSQVIWRNTETGQDIGEAGGQWVGTPGSADPGYYHRGHEDFPDHTGHVHTTVVKDPFTGAPYNQLPGNTDIRPGAPGFPDWVYRLGNQFGLQAATYPGHQVWNGINHGIDWYPKGKINSDLSDRGYTHQDHVTLTSFAQAVGQSAVGGGSAPGGGGNNVFTASYVPGSSDTDGDGSAGAPFDGGNFPQGSPIGPGGLIGPGYNPWSNPPPGLRGDKLQDYTHKYEQWQLEEDQRRRHHAEAQDNLTDAIQEQADAYKQWKALDDKWRAETADQQKLDTETQKKLQDATEKLSATNSKLEHARDTALQDQLDDQVGHPPPQPGKEGGRGGPFESISDQLGQGLVKGIFQELGLPDVFGKPFTSFGLWRLGMGALGFGLNVAGQKGLFGGGSGQDVFPGSLPGQFGGPLGTPPGPPDGSPAAAAPASEAPGPGGGTPGFPAPPHASAPPAAPTKPQLHWDAAKGEWFDQNNNLVQPWKFQAPTSAGGLGGNFDIGKPVPPPPPPAPRAPLQPPLGPAPHGADHWDPNKGWVDAQGNPVGTPGGGQSAPFGVPGLSNSLFGADYEAAANTPAPFSFGGDGPAAGGFGGDYMKQVVNQGPALLVGLQDKNFRAKTFGAFGSHRTLPVVPKPPLISFDGGGFNIWSSAGHAISSGAKSFGHWLMGGDHPPQSLRDLPTPKSGPGQKPGPSVWDQMKQHELDPLGLGHSHESVTSKLKSSFTKKFLQALTQSEMPLPSAAAGGINLPTHATIQQPVGTRGLVQWAEPSTGGEAFIPLKGGQRSLDIWAQTGKMLGAFADGGVIGADPNAPSKLAGHMQGARPNTTHTHQGGSSTTFNINQSGVMSPGQAADKIRSVAVREAAWKGPNQMFATGLQMS